MTRIPKSIKFKAIEKRLKFVLRHLRTAKHWDGFTWPSHNIAERKGVLEMYVKDVSYLIENAITIRGKKRRK